MSTTYTTNVHIPLFVHTEEQKSASSKLKCHAKEIKDTGPDNQVKPLLEPGPSELVVTNDIQFSRSQIRIR